GRVGGNATFAARLTGSNGPIAGAAVTFSYRGETYSTVTDEAGRATTQVKLTGPPGKDQIITTFAGSDVYNPSSDTDDFEVMTGQ
ncbi:MAG: Ig-like domain repeat protein, partial [Actinobacteria bacterium]|nr:Ig-like domain repeat protein [Actinomycetota bacterium]